MVKKKPLSDVLTALLPRLVKLDAYQFFGAPVDPAQAPGYLERIKTPMDLSTIRGKVEAGEYASFREFEDDVTLICDNCELYNPPNTEYHKAAVKFRRVVAPVLARAAETVIDPNDPNGNGNGDDDDAPVTASVTVGKKRAATAAAAVDDDDDDDQPRQKRKYVKSGLFSKKAKADKQAAQEALASGSGYTGEPFGSGITALLQQHNQPQPVHATSSVAAHPSAASVAVAAPPRFFPRGTELAGTQAPRYTKPAPGRPLIGGGVNTASFGVRDPPTALDLSTVWRLEQELTAATGKESSVRTDEDAENARVYPLRYDEYRPAAHHLQYGPRYLERLKQFVEGLPARVSTDWLNDKYDDLRGVNSVAIAGSSAAPAQSQAPTSHRARRSGFVVPSASLAAFCDRTLINKALDAGVGLPALKELDAWLTSAALVPPPTSVHSRARGGSGSYFPPGFRIPIPTANRDGRPLQPHQIAGLPPPASTAPAAAAAAGTHAPTATAASASSSSSAASVTSTSAAALGATPTPMPTPSAASNHAHHSAAATPAMTATPFTGAAAPTPTPLPPLTARQSPFAAATAATPSSTPHAAGHAQSQSPFSFAQPATPAPPNAPSQSPFR